jgi:hypothetical protein
MAPRDADRILETGYAPVETGHRRLANGTVLVSALTTMPGVKAKMIRWWFADFMRTTEHYTWWHPRDHVWMDWEDKRSGEYVGASHLVHERIGGHLQKLRIHFVDPRTFFTPEKFADFEGVAVCAEVGELERPVNIARMCHVIRDTEWGCEMRSRFWLGIFAGRKGNPVPQPLLHLLGNNPVSRRLMMPRWLPSGLQRHCSEEMSYLAGFLAELYRRETGDHS